jgi:hypothetical protein
MSMRELIDTLNTLAASDLSGHSVDELVAQIGPLTRGLIVTAPRFKPGVMLFRGRTGTRCEHRNELSYPPAHLVELGRANQEGSSIFYGTTLRSVVFFEVPNDVGDQLLISRWRTVDRLLVNHLGYTATVFKELGSSRDKAGWDGRSDPLKGDDASREALEILGSLFARRDPGLYKLTAALAEFFMRPPLNGLIYPTIAMSANADNLALKPNWVDTGLDFVGVELVRIDAVRGFERDVTVIDYATARSDGSLEWKGRGPNWKLAGNGQQLTLRPEQGVWVARDHDGNIVDPS